ncbi:MAG: AAA family ATPase [Spirochaetales bacterium]|nr:AAA family ATPase [Spirochaetales bacterium]
MSSLDRLTIKGFKSIKTLEDFSLGKLNIFIGGNGAGKTNLIGFFRMLRSLIDGNLGNYVVQNGGAGDLLFNGPKITTEMEFTTIFGIRGYCFTLKPTPKDKCIITAEKRFYKYARTGGGWWDLGDGDDDTSLLVKEAKSKRKDSQYSLPVYEAIASWQIYHFHDTSETSAMRQYEIIQDNKYLRGNASNIAPYLFMLKNKYFTEYTEILNAVRMVMPFFDDFLLDITDFGRKQKLNLSWKQKGSDYPMQPYHLSDGSLRFICLATALLQPDPPSTIIIDEPELGLHPEAISILSELIQDASKRTQIIVATQSPALIDHFGIEDIIVVKRENGASTFQRLNEEDFKTWLENYSVGELWTKNVIDGGPVYE